MNPKYRFILDLPHHVSPTRPRMSRHDRAAQFSPFAALTGHETVLEKTAQMHLRPEELAQERFWEHLRQLEETGSAADLD